jgi:hypothetical protein
MIFCLHIPWHDTYYAEYLILTLKVYLSPEEYRCLMLYQVLLYKFVYIFIAIFKTSSFMLGNRN